MVITVTREGVVKALEKLKNLTQINPVQSELRQFIIAREAIREWYSGS